MNRSRTTSRLARRRGYTAVEVALSILVLGIGAAGAMTMQAASIQGNSDARMMDVGNGIAREWVERLRRDAMTWTTPNLTTSCSGQGCNWYTNTFLISQIGSDANASTWVWPDVPSSGGNAGKAFSIAATPGAAAGTSPYGYGRGFDALGRDLAIPSGGATALPGLTFCVNLKGDWLLQDQILHATVRVYWPRQMFTAASALFCSGPAEMAGSASQTYHFIYATTAVQRNSAQ
jgi:type II secretory pathway pseudopilin PulG